MLFELLGLPVLQLAFGAYRLFALPDAPVWFFLLPLGEIFLLRILLDTDRNSRHVAGLKTLALTLLAGVLLAFNAGESFYRINYLQHFNPWTDLSLIPGLVGLFFPSIPLPDSLLRVLSVCFAVIILGAISAAAVHLLKYMNGRRKAAPVRHARTVNILLLLAAIALICAFPAQSPLFTVARDAYRTLHIGVTPVTGGASGAEKTATVPTPLSAAGLQDADIHLIVVESYGATLLERPEYIQTMRPLYAELEGELAAAGYMVLSGTVRSPAFGGRSWLADATLLTGIQIGDQMTYDRLAEGAEPAKVPALAGESGYHRIYAAPGTKTAPEAWRRAYPFDRYILRADFEYEGPFVSFGAMPDQYLLDYTARTALRPDEKDFALYLLVSSHVPFEVIPVYREDWDFSRSGREFEDETMLGRYENNWLGGAELAEGYLAGIDYALRSSIGLFTRKLEGENLGLIIGDHQPRKPVSHASADYQVPFHLLVPEHLYTGELAAKLAFWKLAPGLEPRPDPDAPGMDSIALLLETLVLAEP